MSLEPWTGSRFDQHRADLPKTSTAVTDKMMASRGDTSLSTKIGRACIASHIVLLTASDSSSATSTALRGKQVADNACSCLVKYAHLHSILETPFVSCRHGKAVAPPWRSH